MVRQAHHDRARMSFHPQQAPDFITRNDEMVKYRSLQGWPQSFVLLFKTQYQARLNAMTMWLAMVGSRP